MNENQLFDAAKLMFLHNSGRKDVIDYLNQNGITDEKAETMATNAFLAVKDQIRKEEVIEEGAGFPGWIVYIGILLVINLLSYIFDWPFWIY